AGMYSGGTMKSSMDANARATLSFTGASVTFITMSDEWSGIAQIYVDGNPATQVDLYASPAIRQAKAYTVSGLTPGPHTVGIGPIGRKSAGAQGYWIQLDAFDVATTSDVTTAPGPASTTISGRRGWGTSGSTATLTATLTSGGSGLSGKTISFTLNGTAAGTGATNSSGVATLSGVSLTGINAGNYSTALSANFDGDTSYAASSGSGALTVTASTSDSGTSGPAPTNTPTTTPSTSGNSTSGNTATGPTATPTQTSGSSQVLTTSGGPAMQVGSAQLLASAGQQSAPSGLAIFGYRGNGVLGWEAGVPGTVPARRGRIYTEVSGSANTGLAIANPNDSAATVSFFFTDTNGKDFGSGTTTIPAHGQIARFLNETPFNGPQRAQGTFTFSSSIPVSALAIRGFLNERSEFLITTLPLADPNALPSGTVYFPQFADGAGWITQFVLVNPSDQAISGTLSFNGQGTAGAPAPSLSMNIDGTVVNQVAYSIPAHSSKRFSTMDSSLQMKVGCARATPAPFSTAPVGAAIFSYHNGGITVSEAGTPSMIAGNAFRLYAEADSSNAIQTAVAVENAGSSATSVNFELMW